MLTLKYATVLVRVLFQKGNAFFKDEVANSALPEATVLSTRACIEIGEREKE